MPESVLPTYVQVSSVARTAHEDPVRLTGLRDRGQEVWSIVMGSQGVGC